ncbi:PAAR-like protein, partial [Hymenobacter latericoloratus]
MPFQTTPRTSKIAGLQAGNALDKVPIANIPSFIICKKLTQQAGGTPVPCVPAPTLWQDTYPAKVGGAETLLFRSCINCPLGQGKIEFLTSGQLPMPPEMSQQIKETREEADEALKQAELEKNSVGEAGLLEGMIPLWGSGRDLIHAAQTGDKMGVALNAAFLVWDVASVAAGVLTFGTATAAMMGAKAGVRTALKAGAKVAA